MTLTSLARPSYMPKYKPDASCVLYLEGQQDPYSSTIRDLSGKGNHGTITGATWVRLPSGLWVNKFDGTDDEITIPEIQLAGAYTLLLWVNKAPADGVFSPVSGWSGGNCKLGFNNSNTNVFIRAIALTGSSDTTAVWTPGANVWGLLGIIRDASDVVSVIVNNSLTVVFGGAPQSGIMHVDLIGKSEATQFFKGYIVLKRIFNTALSATEIAGIFYNERHLFGV
jgi:hypothetical protein